MEYWTNYSLESDIVRYWRIGALDLWMRRTDEEWLYAWRHRDDDDAAPTLDAGSSLGTELPAETEWYRAVTRSSSLTVKFSPLMPDRTVIANPRNPLKLLPGTTVYFYAIIPVFLGVSVLGTHGEERVFEIPTRMLTNTWLGDMFAGKLCYTLASDLYHYPDKAPQGPTDAICPVRLRNTADDPFVVEKIGIFADMMNLYRRADVTVAGLWTGESRTDFTRDKELSISVSETRPMPSTDRVLLSKARKSTFDSIWKKGISLLAKISNY
ncbi:MAG: hypothetical protein EA426_15635 [Spirochaetaceae bacterium]|nr:MAG: hypothetical protein EA426_15635 [Spirochaetaceae bacterium]